MLWSFGIADGERSARDSLSSSRLRQEPEVSRLKAHPFLRATLQSQGRPLWIVTRRKTIDLA